jgi:hypothetical protein
MTERHRPTHVALYDLERRTCEQEIELEPHGIGVIFSLLPAPNVGAKSMASSLKESGKTAG